MHVLNTWLSATNKKNEADRSREVFGMLAASLPGTENIQTDKLKDLIYNLCKRFAAYWKNLGRSKSKLIGKYSDWLNEIEVCILRSSDGGLREYIDLLNRLPLNSDPLISSIRKLPCKKKSVLAKEVLDLLSI